MSRPILLSALALVLFPALLLAQETTVYKSKNADGTSVYTQIETRGSEARELRSRDPDQPEAAEETPKTSTQIACEGAQANLALLNSGSQLQRDKDGDGVLELLTDEEMATERDLAERQVTAYCPQPAS